MEDWNMQANKLALGNVLVTVTALVGVFLVGFLIFGASHPLSPLLSKSSGKPTPAEIIQMLKSGNERFYTGNAIYPHTDAARIALAAQADQGNHATATVISCSDSRVPVELIFDAGIMDIFVIRVAGNVADTDEIGSIEYGLAHVNTPVLVVLGHTRCGAVTAVAQAVQGHGHKLERNIPPLVDNIVPAVKRAMDRHQDLHGDALIPYAIEENIWQSIEDLFMKSPAVRNLVKKEKVIVAGAVYDLASGKVEWLDTEKVSEILGRVEASAAKETEPFAQ
jgi:carbonic anhydrase